MLVKPKYRVSAVYPHFFFTRCLFPKKPIAYQQGKFLTTSKFSTSYPRFPIQLKFRLKRTRVIVWLIFFTILLFFLFSLPRSLFHKPTSTVLYDSEGELLSAVIAADDQWRFPPVKLVPEKFEKCLLTFEDQHFYEHNGVYLPSVIRALYQNITSQKVVSGASTISMQVVRLSRDNPGRSMSEKLLEMIRAMRLETMYSKKDILALYSSNAPFGGNVVGLEAAAWRYYGRTSEQLSWAESATLAVLPNAPSLIFPGKNQELLLQKRNRVLKSLYESGHIDIETFELSCTEPLPQKPFPLPQTAPHLLQSAAAKFGYGNRYHTTIHKELQEDVAEIVQRHVQNLSANQVHNAAVLVVETSTGNVLAYVGNAKDEKNRHGNQVDVIPAPRSTGSILKPILYAAMLKDGLILPKTLMADIPIQYEGFAPKNYSETFDGAVPASQALSRSLNVPSVMMLRDYGYTRFYHLLKKMGFSHLNNPADHYGLSLILGGAEASLWDITHAYAAMSRTLNDYHALNGEYVAGNYEKGQYLKTEKEDDEKVETQKFPLLDAGSVWCTYQALLEVNRPESELGWEMYHSSTPIAWKTGTSFGNRDAWAVGTTPEYVVGVWVGNADGQGRPELTGVQSAAPILFEVFNLIKGRTWYHTPHDDLEPVAVCKESGMRAGQYCNHIDTTLVPHGGTNSLPCKYHKLIHVNSNGTERVNVGCVPSSQIRPESWFCLPPVQEYYYKNKHPEYIELPPFAEGCDDDESPIALLYPHADTKLYVPRNLEGKTEKVVIEATHRDPDAILYWHINGSYVGQTHTIHQFEISAVAGICYLTIMDQNGASLAKRLEFFENSN